MVVFGFFILLGVVAFSTYKGSSSSSNLTQISIWGTVDQTLFNNYISKYKQDTGTDLKITYTEKSLDSIDGDLVEAMATGKAPDAILIPQELEDRYLDKVYMITSIPQRTFEDTFVQEAELYIQPNGIFGLPFFVDPMVMYWNQDLFSSAAIALPPTEWAQFPSLASKLSESDNNANIIKSAASFGEFENVDNAKALLSTMIMQAGSPIVSADSQGNLASALDEKSATDVMVPAELALQFFTGYSNPKNSVYSWNISLPSSKESFLAETLATYFGFGSEYSDIQEKNPNLNFDVAMVPQTADATAKVTFGELYGFAILKTSPNISQALNTLLTLVSANSVSEFLQLDYVAPARKDLLSAGSQDPIKTVIYNSALISKGWIDPDYQKTSQIFQDMVENVTTGRDTVEDSVSNASDQLNSLFLQ